VYVVLEWMGPTREMLDMTRAEDGKMVATI